MTYSVLIVDDHELIRQGLRRAFEREPAFTVSGEAGSLTEGLARARSLLPDVVVTDVNMPGGSGLELVRALRQERPEVGLVVLTMHSGDEQLFTTLEAGASAFVNKDAPAAEVVAAARHAVASPRSFTANDLGAAMRRRLAAPDPVPTLSKRELEVLSLLASGLNIVQLAGRLYISESTAKSHISHIYAKLGAANRSQALMTAVRLGLVSAD